MENKIKVGETVEWSYTHWLNKKSSTIITKKGKVVSIIIPKKKYLADWVIPIHAKVLFEGNKTESKVLMSKLRVLSNINP